MLSKLATQRKSLVTAARLLFWLKRFNLCTLTEFVMCFIMQVASAPRLEKFPRSSVPSSTSNSKVNSHPS